AVPRDLLAQPRDGLGKLGRARGGFSEPERNVGSRAVGVLDAHAALLDALDAPGSGSQQEHAAGNTFYGEIFVHRSHYSALGLGDHLIIRVVRNRAAGSDGGQARAAPAADAMVDAVVVDVRAASAARGGDAVREHGNHGVEIAPFEIAIRIDRTDELK